MTSNTPSSCSHGKAPHQHNGGGCSNHGEGHSCSCSAERPLPQVKDADVLPWILLSDAPGLARVRDSASGALVSFIRAKGAVVVRQEQAAR